MARSNAGPSFLNQIVSVKPKDAEASVPPLSKSKHDSGSEMPPSTSSQVSARQESETSVNRSFGELLKAFSSRHEKLSAGVLVDQVYAVAPSDLNALLFSPSSEFLQSLAQMQGNTGLDVQGWSLVDDGGVLKRVVSYTRAATKLLRPVKATQEEAYLKADGDMYAVLSSVITPDVPFGNYFREEILTSIMPGPELTNGERSSRLVISWRVNFMRSTMMKGIIENGTRQGLTANFSQYSELLARLLAHRRWPYSPVSPQELVRTRTPLLLYAPSDLEVMLRDESSRPHNIPLHDLKEITDNFSDERILGQGGFGVVYKGVLRNGKMIAVKKTVSSLMPGLQKQFESEVYHLMMLKHPNIVRCVGYCYETRNECLEYNGSYVFAEMAERLLCLEYLHKGSLDKYISDESSGLDWSTRYSIIEGICHGLCHLHEQIDRPIIHLDLKPANILLDDSLVPKITDFGMSRLFGQQQTICTSSCVGTLGYMAPEFLHGGIITPKLDIFSLGVIILEIITGHRDYPGIAGTSSDDFIELALEKWRNVLQRSPGYGSLELDYQQIKRCIHVGLICVNRDRTKRPPIAKIINMLRGSESIDCNVNCEAA